MNMNTDPRLKHIPPFALESDYERDMHQRMYEEERAERLRQEELDEFSFREFYPS